MSWNIRGIMDNFEDFINLNIMGEYLIRFVMVFNGKTDGLEKMQGRSRGLIVEILDEV